MQGSEPAKQVNYYVDVHIQDQVAALKGLFGLSREDPGARLRMQSMLILRAKLGPHNHVAGTSTTRSSTLILARILR